MNYMSSDLKDQDKYIAVDMGSLEPGMLVERPLYGYFSVGQKYIRMVAPLQPLEPRVLEKLQKIGSVFSTEEGIEKRYPDLIGTGRIVRRFCDNRDVPPFEKNAEVKKFTKWLVPLVLGPNKDLTASLFFFHRAFGAPPAETLQFVSDLSVTMCERSLRTSALAGVLALWLGYTDTEYLTQFAGAVFCEEVGRYSQEGFVDELSEVSDDERAVAAAMLREGKIPGLESVDERFKLLLSSRDLIASAGDEMKSVVEYARELSGVRPEGSTETWRVSRKLKEFLFTELKQERKAAA